MDHDKVIKTYVGGSQMSVALWAKGPQNGGEKVGVL